MTVQAITVQPTYSDISAGIASTLATAVGIAVVQHELSLSEAIADVPLIQVYMQDDEPQEATERMTFRAGARWNRSVWYADLYAHERGDLGENIRDVYQYGQAVKDVLNSMKNLEEGNAPPFFGVTGIQTYHWRAERLTLEVATQGYSAMRFILTLNLY
jgi:hypothetical protein